MTVHLSVSVMHHPKRASYLPSLLSRLDSRTHVICDEKSEGVWPTARRAWTSYDPAATHHLVLQDDVVPCLDFLAGAERALSVHPEVPVSFYANRAAVEEARAVRVNWAVIPDGAWGQAMCLPVSMIPPWLAWVDENVMSSFKHDDSRLTMWLLRTRCPVWCTAPSLVEHGLPGESLLGNSNRGRVARWYIGADKSALSIDWSMPGAVEGKGPSWVGYASKYKQYLIHGL